MNMVQAVCINFCDYINAYTSVHGAYLLLLCDTTLSFSGSGRVFKLMLALMKPSIQ